MILGRLASAADSDGAAAINTATTKQLNGFNSDIMGSATVVFLTASFSAQLQSDATSTKSPTIDSNLQFLFAAFATFCSDALQSEQKVAKAAKNEEWKMEGGAN